METQKSNNPVTATLVKPQIDLDSERKAAAQQAKSCIFQKGDSIYRIAKLHGISCESLLKANSLDANSARLIQPGTKITIPDATKNGAAALTHTIRPGETIYKIAQNYGIDPDTILAANQLNNELAKNINSGREIIIPGLTHEKNNSSDSDNPSKSAISVSGKFKVTSQTRDEIGQKSVLGSRLVSLDFNSSVSGTARGIEIVIPDNASPLERQLAGEYLKQTQLFFKQHGIDREIRGILQRKDCNRGVPGYFHTEPFFIQDKEAFNAIKNNPKAYSAVLARTLGKLPGVTFIAPHKSDDPGAIGFGTTERDFAKAKIIPALASNAKK